MLVMNAIDLRKGQKSTVFVQSTNTNSERNTNAENQFRLFVSRSVCLSVCYALSLVLNE